LLLLKNLQYTGKIMFEIFNVPGLYIVVQAALAIAAEYIISKWMLKMGLHTWYL